MKNTIGNLVDTEFKKAYDNGYYAGIMEAVKILKDAHLAEEVIAAQEPYPDGEATYSIPGNEEATFDEKEAYYAVNPVIGSDDEEPPVIEDVFAPRKSPIKHAKHRGFWEEHEVSFALQLEIGVMTVSEAVEGAKPFGVSYKGVKSKASRFGYGIKKNKFYKKAGK